MIGSVTKQFRNFGVFSKTCSRMTRSYSHYMPTEAVSQEVITIETDVEARQMLDVLKKYPNHPFACDTEVADIDVRKVGPVGNGDVICISIYGGPDIEFQKGFPGQTLWVDNLDLSEGVLSEFSEWFKDPQYKTVWHNFGFDKHVLRNEGIEVQGFAGDTMHMARLWDTGRDKATGNKGYSLEALSTDLLGDSMGLQKVSMKRLFGGGGSTGAGDAAAAGERPTLRAGGLPDLAALQRDRAGSRAQWILYSARDALVTWWLFQDLAHKLGQVEWLVDGVVRGTMMDFYDRYFVPFGDCLTVMEHNGIRVDQRHLSAAEETAKADLVRMQELFSGWTGSFCSDAHLINTSSTAQLQQLLFGTFSDKVLVDEPKEFAVTNSDGDKAAWEETLLALNPYADRSVEDLKALLRNLGLKPAGGSKASMAARLVAMDDALANPAYSEWGIRELRETCIARNIALPKRKAKAKPRGKGKGVDVPTEPPSDGAEVDNELSRNELVELLVADKAKHIREGIEDAVAQKRTQARRTFTIPSMGMEPLEFTPKGAAQVSTAVLRRLAGSNLNFYGEAGGGGPVDGHAPKYGDAYPFFYERALKAGASQTQAEASGREACVAIGALANAGQIETTIGTFLQPLQALADADGRIHCSLNMNTETGRLSSRRPNLQNQPALEKDQYKIRDAFVAEEGNTLIVADYGQLELRVLAHITSCHSMLEAFETGGCFHSRTAMGMYDHVREAVERGEVLLEWDYTRGLPPVALVKDKFAAERRMAKTLNFSIAYGKTVHGLALDWGISQAEAEKTLSAWYADRPEVRQWQEDTRAMARRTGAVTTMMGRYRNLPDALSQGDFRARGHALRAAINTPIQGSAADIVMMAMLRIWRSEVLRALKWKLLLQIHDEVILEGPEEHRDAAMAEVLECMQNPFDGIGLMPMRVKLEVDAKSAKTWYKAK